MVELNEKPVKLLRGVNMGQNGNPGIEGFFKDDGRRKKQRARTPSPQTLIFFSVNIFLKKN